MQYNRFGNTGMSVSRLSIGAMTFGGAWGKVVDLEAAQGIIDNAIERGVNLIDTADTYGESEVLVGKILKANGKRDSVFLCTKVYLRRTHGERASRNGRINIFHAIDTSLKRLQVDHVDLYQLHHPDPDAPLDETVRALDEIVKQGKTRYVGATNHYAWQMVYHNAVAERLHAEPLGTTQNSYSLLDRGMELEFLHLVRKFNLGFMVWSPLAGGLLARHYDANHPVEAKGRPAKFKERLDKTGSDLVYRTLEELRAIASEQNSSLAQLSAAWLLAKPVVSTILMGGSKPEHFTTLLDIADKTLDATVAARLDKLTEPAIYGPYFNQPFPTAPGLARI